MLKKYQKLINSTLALYLIDWLSCIILLIVSVIWELVIYPFERPFSLTDTSIQYTFQIKETVPMWLLWVLAIIIPVLIILLFYLKTKNFGIIHWAVIGFILSCSISFGVTHFLKNLIGRLRPDFISRCQPNQVVIEETGKLYTLYTGSICSQTDIRIMKDGRQSFPSGHTSVAFSGLGYLAYFLGHMLGLSHNRRASLFQYYAILIPLCVATFIGISRIRDYRHHWQDVLVGGILGMLSAYFSYNKYFKKRLLIDAAPNQLNYSSNSDNSREIFTNTNNNANIV